MGRFKGVSPASSGAPQRCLSSRSCLCATLFVAVMARISAALPRGGYGDVHGEDREEEVPVAQRSRLPVLRGRIRMITLGETVMKLGYRIATHVAICLSLLASLPEARAQLDSKHYLPPLSC